MSLEGPIVTGTITQLTDRREASYSPPRMSHDLVLRPETSGPSTRDEPSPTEMQEMLDRLKEQWDTPSLVQPPYQAEGVKSADQPQGRKPSVNPKDRIGVSKWRQVFCIPPRVLWELGVAMLEGAMKYGRFNYRASGVQASIYIDAAQGHINSWIEGEDIDPDSGLSHITKAICSLVVLRDGMIEGNFIDDRPPSHGSYAEHTAYLQEVVEGLFKKHPVAARPHTISNPHALHEDEL